MSDPVEEALKRYQEAERELDAARWALMSAINAAGGRRSHARLAASEPPVVPPLAALVVY